MAMRITIACLLCLFSATLIGAEPNLLSVQQDWIANGPLITAPAGSDWHSVKDPSVVHFDGNWHLFCTLRGSKRSHATGYFRFKEWSDAAKAELHVLPNHDGFFCAPQVFYFTPRKEWFLICQASSPDWKPNYQPAFATNKDISDAKGWSKLRPIWDSATPKVKAWLDFWVICDDAKAHLFYTSLDGKMWRAETPIAKFPHGWSEPIVALEGDIFEASHTYKSKGTDKYITVVEAQNGHGWRYYKSYVAEKLDGKWIPLAAQKDQAFASMRNVKQSGTKWTDAISHGELIRTGHDEKLEVDGDKPQFLIQGVLDKDRVGKKYGDIPWRLGLLERGK
jgi:hypothetical protein